MATTIYEKVLYRECLKVAQKTLDASLNKNTVEDTVKALRDTFTIRFTLNLNKEKLETFFCFALEHKGHAVEFFMFDQDGKYCQCDTSLVVDNHCTGKSVVWKYGEKRAAVLQKLQQEAVQSLKSWHELPRPDTKIKKDLKEKLVRMLDKGDAILQADTI